MSTSTSQNVMPLQMGVKAGTVHFTCGVNVGVALNCMIPHWHKPYLSMSYKSMALHAYGRISNASSVCGSFSGYIFTLGVDHVIKGQEAEDYRFGAMCRLCAPHIPNLFTHVAYAVDYKFMLKSPKLFFVFYSVLWVIGRTSGMPKPTSVIPKHSVLGDSPQPAVAVNKICRLHTMSG